MPFRWHERHDRFAAERYQMERIHDRGWGERFPGLRSYRWHDSYGEGFWYQGQRISDAVFFYNPLGELVGVGFMHHGVFIYLRDDNACFENRDSFLALPTD